ncbi:hypothetical protein LTR27_011381 [Elasticomyces elasticus]|nr:hypothetical protein LTR27_011381 [Elasticomyces elasticus]
MAEHLVQEYLDRAQAAEQTVLQLKIDRAKSERDNEVNVKAVAHYCKMVKEADKRLSEQKKKIAELEETIEETKIQAPSNLVAELKEMLKAAMGKIEELEVAAPASATTVTKEPENDVAPHEVPAGSPKTHRLPSNRVQKKYATCPGAPGWQRTLHNAAAAQNASGGGGYCGLRTWYVPPLLRNSEQGAVAARPMLRRRGLRLGNE